MLSCIVADLSHFTREHIVVVFAAMSVEMNGGDNSEHSNSTNLSHSAGSYTEISVSFVTSFERIHIRHLIDDRAISPYIAGRLLYGYYNIILTMLAARWLQK